MKMLSFWTQIKITWIHERNLFEQPEIFTSKNKRLDDASVSPKATNVNRNLTAASILETGQLLQGRESWPTNLFPFLQT